MKDANTIALVILAVVGLPALILMQLTNTAKAESSQSRIGEILPGTYEVSWYKQAGGFLRTKVLSAEQMIVEVKRTFARAHDTMMFEEFSDGYKFSRANWRHAHNAEGQKFGYILAKRISDDLAG